MSTELNDEQRAAIIFAGDLIIFRQMPAMLALCELTQTLINHAFADLSPLTAQELLDKETYLNKVHELQTAYAANNQAKQLFFQVLQQTGCDIARTFWDHLTMRVVPYGKSHNGGYRGEITPHRDSWGSKLYEQVNWWAPIYPLEAERSIVFFPDYWSNGISNDTDSWSFKTYIEQRKQTPIGRKVNYYSAPRPTVPVDWLSAISIVPDPGDLLCFSSAHLHASMPNQTNAARFSIELRTVSLLDIQADRCAPNVDCAEGERMLKWFKSMNSHESLQLAIEN